MDGTRLKRLKEKLEITDLKQMDQKQFNDLITNLTYLDQETVRHVVRNVPELSEKVLNYFTQLNETTKIDTTDYLESMKSHNQILTELIKEDVDENLKNKIADELLEHSKWLRKEATITRVFKMAVTAIGLGLAFVFAKGMKNNTKYKPEHARVSLETNKEQYSNDGYINDNNSFDEYINNSNSSEKEINNDDYLSQPKNSWDDLDWENDNNYNATFNEEASKKHVYQRTRQRDSFLRGQKTNQSSDLQRTDAKNSINISAANKKAKFELTI